jgi:hypothetical protein
MRIGPLVTMSGLPPLRTVPVEASSAHNAPPLFPGGAQQMSGPRPAAPRGRAIEDGEAVALHPFPDDVQIVPMKTTPPALTAGTDRGRPGDNVDPAP